MCVFDMFHNLFSGDSLRDLWNVYMYVCNIDQMVTGTTSVSACRIIFFHVLLFYHNHFHGLYSMKYPSRNFQVPSLHSGKCIIRNLDVKIPSRSVINKGELMERLVSCVT